MWWDRWKFYNPEAAAKMEGKTIELTIDGDTISSTWWTPELSELFCNICYKKGTEECNKMLCQSANHWCG
jgi:hypothetical protein